MMKYKCPVCGYPDLHQPPGLQIDGTSEICRCCGFRFSHAGANETAMYDPWRKRWIETGMQWRLGRPPEGWDAVKQLRSIAIPVDPHKFSSDLKSVKHMCPVCGYPELSEPARRAGGGGSYEICHSCGFEFGVSDDDQGFTDERWRQKWIDNGMRWQSVGRTQPEGWNPVEQLSNLTKQR